MMAKSGATLYYKTDWVWPGWLGRRAGLRGDRDAFQIPGLDSTTAGLVNPKLGLVFGPWSRTEYFVNYGQGFHSNDARVRQTPLVRARGAELGVRATPLPGWQSSLALWRRALDLGRGFPRHAGTTGG